MKLQSKIFFGPFLIICAALLWAFDGVLRRYLYSIPPIHIIFFEHLIGLLILVPFVWRIVLKQRLNKKEFGLLVLVALLSGLLGTLWFTTALLQIHFISFSVVFLLQKLQPIFAISSASVFLKEKFSRNYIPWALLAILSAYFVTFKDGFVDLNTGESTVIAALYALGAAFAWGTSTTFSKMILKTIDTKVATFYRFGLTILFAFIFMIFMGQFSTLSWPTASELGVFLVIALSTGMVALFVYYKGLSHTPVHISTILELVFPFVAIVIDAVVYKTLLSPSQLVASIVLVYSIYRITKLHKIYGISVKTN